jgi:mono/diheme cytochrome c family protein
MHKWLGACGLSPKYAGITGLISVGGICLVLAGCGTTASRRRIATTVSNTAAVISDHVFYQQVCAYCHGDNGQGGMRFNAPRLWGHNNVVTSGTYNTVGPLSAYIKRAMPAQAVNGTHPGGLIEIQSHQSTL